jgi:hypothetical protein
MDRNPYAAPTSELEMPTPGTVSMVRYGAVCLLTLFLIVTTFALTSRFAGAPLWPGISLVGLAASIHFAGWRFVRTHRRVMSRIEMKRFALACGVAFWVFDEGASLIRLIRTPGDQPIRAAVTWIIGSGFDLALVAAIVYVTVPPMARYVVRSMSDSTRRSPQPK